jgi:hypothetical protein
VVVGDGGHEAYTAILWGVLLSRESSKFAEAETVSNVEGNMCGTAMRGADALPGSKTASRRKGSRWNPGLRRPSWETTQLICLLPDWAFYLLIVAGSWAFHIYRARLIRHTEERVYRRQYELDTWEGEVAKNRQQKQAGSLAPRKKDATPQSS